MDWGAYWMDGESDGLEIWFGLVDKVWRVYYGDDERGRYINVAYDDIRDYVTDKKPRDELISKYFQGSQ